MTAQQLQLRSLLDAQFICGGTMKYSSNKTPYLEIGPETKPKMSVMFDVDTRCFTCLYPCPCVVGYPTKAMFEKRQELQDYIIDTFRAPPLPKLNIETFCPTCRALMTRNHAGGKFKLVCFNCGNKL